MRERARREPPRRGARARPRWRRRRRAAPSTRTRRRIALPADDLVAAGGAGRTSTVRRASGASVTLRERPARRDACVWRDRAHDLLAQLPAGRREPADRLVSLACSSRASCMDFSARRCASRRTSSPRGGSSPLELLGDLLGRDASVSWSVFPPWPSTPLGLLLLTVASLLLEERSSRGSARRRRRPSPRGTRRPPAGRIPRKSRTANCCWRMSRGGHAHRGPPEPPRHPIR